MIAAQPIHAAALAAIHAASFPSGEQWDAGAMTAQLSQPGVFGWLEDSGGLILARVAADEAEVLTLAVVPEARRRGVGRMLLTQACAEAAARGAATMFLEVAADNDAARALYAALGFRPVGQRRAYYPGGVDALVLRRVHGGGSSPSAAPR